jgi:diguanylate cyclase
MTSPFREMQRPSVAPADRGAHTRRLAEAAWAAIERHDVLPTPRNFDLFFTYHSATDPELTRRLDLLLRDGGTLSEAVLETLYNECVAPAEIDLDAVSAGSQAIQDAAQTLVEQVAGSQAAIRGYGETLAHWAAHLGDEPTLAALVKAVATLSEETRRAGERNRALEQQLSASVARIAKLRQNLAEVKQEVAADPLTGIANRKAFEARLRRAIVQARTERGALSVLLLDIDHFKRFNDHHGHRTGDLVLRLVGRVLSDNVKGRDCAARYGGEEFAILLVGATLQAGAVVAQQICDALSGKHLVNKGSGRDLGRVTVSVGVAQFQDHESAAALVERADLALYEAKRTGRNRVCVDAAPTEAEPAVPGPRTRRGR